MADSSGGGRQGFRLPRLLAAALLLIAFSSVVLAQTEVPDYTCSATKPCTLGCCGQHGICGMGPEFCSPENCVNSCDAKSECDPAGWGPQYAANEKCPLNVCCSRFGFCGTTDDFCEGKTVANPSCRGTSATQRTIGYFEGWGVGRACEAMLPETIPLHSYTHINFAFAGIDPVTFNVVAMSPGDIDLMRRLTAMKRFYPGLEVWIAIGGWSMNDPGPTFRTFSDLANSAANQQKFFASLISFMSHYGFDGVDIDWEYPVAEERGGRPSDFQAFPVFMRNLKTAIRNAGKSWGVTLTLPSSFWYMQHFDIVKLEPVVDWFNMMEYDIHGTWDAMSVWTGAKVGAHTNLTEIDQSLKLMWRNGINPAKVVLGLGFYGRSYELTNPACGDPGCPFVGGAPGGPCTNSVGTLSYGEIRRLVRAGATPRLDARDAVQILQYGDRGQYWVSYDDATTIGMKVDYANRNCLGGTMVWAVSTDDPEGSAAAALQAANSGPGGNNYARRALLLNNAALPSTGRCTWTGCGGTCPSGFSGALAVPDGCPQGSSDITVGTRRTFCCPSNNVPRCEAAVDWGHTPGSNEPMICRPRACSSGMALVTTTQTYSWLRYSCHTGHINLCCENTPALAVGACTWSECGGSCPSGTSELTRSLTGPGGFKPCTSGRRALCCPAVGGYQASTCSWRMNAFHGTCTPSCPPNKVMVAVDAAGAGCRRGHGAYCCDPPETHVLAPRSDLGNVIAWEARVRAFMNDPRCSLNEDPGPRGHAPASSGPLASELLNRLSVWIAYPEDRPFNQPFRDAWNRARVATGSQFPDWDQLVSILNLPRSTHGDDYALRIERVLCAASYGRDTIAQNAMAVSSLCRRGPSAAKLKSRDDETMWAAAYLDAIKADEETHPDEIDKRAIQFNWVPGSTNTQLRPTTADVLNEVINGGLRFEYYRWFPYTRRGALNPPAPELEVAFLLGRDPSSIQTRFQGRDLRFAHRPRDTRHRYVIFHIHFDRALTAVTTIDQAPVHQLRITSISMRHGNNMVFNGNPGLVNNAAYRAGRFHVEQEQAPNPQTHVTTPILDCPDETGVNPSLPGNFPPELPLDQVQRYLVAWFIYNLVQLGHRADMRHNLLTLDPPNMDVSTQYRDQNGNTHTPYDPNYRIIGHNPQSPAPMHLPAAWTGETGNGATHLAYDRFGNPYVPGADIRNDGDCYHGPHF